MASELHVAAERFLSGNDGVKDASELARFAAPLLDPTPIDEAWLKSVGFMSDGHWLQFSANGIQMSWYAPHKTNGPVYVHGLTKWQMENPTLGQLRLLALGLGIELGEENA